MSSTSLHYRTCNLCEAMCGLEIEHQDGKVLHIRGDKEDAFSRGHICPKAVALQDIHEDPDRLKQPHRRGPNGFVPISWDEAFDEAARQLKQIQTQHGNDAVALYFGNPTVHNYGSMLFGSDFFRCFRTKNRYSATSVDQLPHQFVARHMFGHQLMIPIPDIDRTQFFVIMGGNPAVSNGSLMSAPDVKKRIKDIKARGGTVVVIDPRRTETARIASRHHFIRPATDALLLLAILHTLHEEKLAHPAHLAGVIEGIDDFWRAVTGTTPEQVAPITGIDAAAIRQLARDFAAAPSAVWYGRLGVSTQPFGALCQWLLQGINIVTGNLDRPGGAMFTRPALDVIGARLSGRGRSGRWHSRVRKLPEFAGELPVSVLAEEMLTPGDGQIRAFITHAGNPVLSTPNGTQLEEALRGLDFMLSIDFYINETTRHANLILPPTGPLEHANYDVIFHILAIQNNAKYSPALFKPQPNTRHDWEILLELETRMRSRDLTSRIKAQTRKRAMQLLGPDGLLDILLRTGPYGHGLNILRGGLTLGKLKKHPHGVDLGPLKPCLPKRLFTAHKRIELAPALLCEDLARLHAHFFSQDDATDAKSTSQNDEDVAKSSQSDAATDNTEHQDASDAASPPPVGTYLLIGRRTLRSNNSWMHNSQRLVKGRNRCTLLMHPDDASAVNLEDGQEVQLTSRVGVLRVPVHISDEMMPGVVSLPHGWGHHREGSQLSVAKAHAGVSINDLTDEQAIDELCGNAAFSAVPVEIAPAQPEENEKLNPA